MLTTIQLSGQSQAVKWNYDKLIMIMHTYYANFFLDERKGE